MSDEILDNDKKESLKVLIYFYLNIGRYDSAYRGARAYCALYKGDIWALGIMIICASNLQDYAQVIKLSDNLDKFAQNKARYKSILLLRMQAFMKMGQDDKVKELQLLLDKD